MLYVKQFNKVLWVFDHLGLKYLNTISREIIMKKDWKMILEVTLEIIKIIIITLK